MASGIQKYSVSEANNLSLGQAGLDVIASNSTETGNWVAIKALYNDITVTTVCSLGDPLTSISITQGDVVYGPFTSVEHASGSAGTCLAYRG